MARSKEYAIKRSAPEPAPAMPRSPIDLVIQLPANYANRRTVDLRKWLGKGFDDWLWASSVALRDRLASGFSPATIVAMSGSGLFRFMDFLTSSGLDDLPRAPKDVQSVHIARYVAWLRRRYENTASSRSAYDPLKMLLLSLAERGFIGAREDDWLPANPIPIKSSAGDLSTALSASEMQRLATALKADLIAIHRGEFVGPGSEAISVLFFIISLRSGLNLTPMLEMRRDCLRPHPLLPNMMLIDTFKRRANTEQSMLVRGSPLVDSSVAIQMDGAAVIRRALEITASLVASAPEHIQDRLWLFRSEQSGERHGQVSCISPAVLHSAIRSIVARHAILSDAGKPLWVTVGILRKTKANLLWRLTDGDVVAVAAAMGHSPRIADNHYLRLDERGKAEGAAFIGEALPDRLRGVGLQPTPTGSCKDTLSGALAPKDGSTHCSDFMHCFSCPSYAIVGTVKDLHRLFSFKEFLKSEADAFARQEWDEWRAQRQRLAEHVDRVAEDNFPAAIVDEARILAERKPHPFWAIKMRSGRPDIDGGPHVPS